MPLNSEAQLLSNDYLAKGMLELFPQRQQFMGVLPFFQIEGSSLTYARTPTLALADATGFCDPIVEHTKLPDSPVSNFVMAELAAHFEVSYKGQDVFCDTNDQFIVQRDFAIRQLLYKFGQLFVTGDNTANPTEFDGLDKLVSPSNVIDLAGGTLTMNAIDQAKGKVRTANGYCDVIFTNQFGYEAIRSAYFDVGTKPERLNINVAGNNGALQQNVTTIDGRVIYMNDLQTTSGIYFASLGWNNLHGIIPYCTGESMFKERKTIRPDDSKDVGHMVFPVGLALGSSGALAQVKNFSGGGP